MSARDRHTAGFTSQGFDPDGAHSPALRTPKRIIAYDLSGATELQGNLSADEGARRAELIRGAKHQAGGVRAIRDQFHVVGLERELVLRGIGGK
jgi:hypothetical protein